MKNSKNAKPTSEKLIVQLTEFLKLDYKDNITVAMVTHKQKHIEANYFI